MSLEYSHEHEFKADLSPPVLSYPLFARVRNLLCELIVSWSTVRKTTEECSRVMKIGEVELDRYEVNPRHSSVCPPGPDQRLSNGHCVLDMNALPLGIDG